MSFAQNQRLSYKLVDINSLNWKSSFQSHIAEESPTSEAAAAKASNGAEDEVKVDKDDETASDDLSPSPRNGLKLPRLSPSGNVVPTAPDLLCQAATNIANPSPYFINPMYQVNTYFEPVYAIDKVPTGKLCQ